jgi:hypothetical protein
MARRRSPYRPGTPSYERSRRAALIRRENLAAGRASRAQKPEAKRRAQRQAATARRGLRQMPERIARAEERRDYRSHLHSRDQTIFSRLPTREQQRLVDVNRQYPAAVPANVTDPFAEPPIYRPPL